MSSDWIKILLPFTFVFIAGCSFSPNELKLADKAMTTSPDSALLILKSIKSYASLSDADQARYGLLYFRALDEMNKKLEPDSLLAKSTKYYQGKNDVPNLSQCIYYKAKLYKQAQKFDNATVLFIGILNQLTEKKENFRLLAKVNSDLGDICSIQRDYDEALQKYKKSIYYFNAANAPTEACYRIIYIGRVYRFRGLYKKAQTYYSEAIHKNKDSMLHGIAIQETGINYYKANKLDSARVALSKSLDYPYKGFDYSIRNLNLAEVYFDLNLLDSANKFANIALKYPSTYFIKKDCYRILANAAYSQGKYKDLEIYLAKYQAWTDSVREIEIQTKSSVLENLYETKNSATSARKYMLILILIIPLLLATALYIVFSLRKRNKGKEKELEEIEEKLTTKQTLLKESIIAKIEENRLMQAPSYKNASPAVREELDKKLYNTCLHVDEWEKFSKLMNQTFNNIIAHIESTYPEANRKELTWCCLYLLDISTPDIALVLGIQQSSLYKLKQRLAQKMNIKTMKEFDQLLLQLSGTKPN